jgi:trehalose 6-phosphate synthase
MRLTIRLLVAIWLSAMAVAAGFAWVSVEAERARLLDDLERRAGLLAEGLQEALEPLGERAPAARVERVIGRFGTPGRGVAVFDRFAGLVAATPEAARALAGPPPFVSAVVAADAVQHGLDRLGDRQVHYYALPLPGPERPRGALVVVHDAGPVEARVRELIRFNAIRAVVLAAVVSLITLLVVRTTVTSPVGRLAEWARQLRHGVAAPAAPPEADRGLFGPLAEEVSSLGASLARARAAAEQEARLRLEGETIWTEERLRQTVGRRLGGRPLFVVSNREPYQHVRRARRLEVVTPASGLVTALDPVMRACGGVWIASGSGDADREAVDERSRVSVPPDDPRYTLRRVWLGREEEAGYYLGFANEGLWPLCHIVHARPTFRPDDWRHYEAVNRKFADAALEEMADTEAPVLLIQDYHFARLAAHVRDKRPDARIALFWHIPWPHPEAFGICPWQADLLEGMLGADIVGFHTQFHCNNFLETVDRTLEARLDWEHFAVVRGSRTTLVKPFPISVAPAFVDDPPDGDRAALLAQLGLGGVEFLGVGVERLDYTKGLPERFRAIGRFFERFPRYRGRLTFVQLAAPSRGDIPRYRELADEVERTVEAVNGPLQTREWRPIVMLVAQHSHRDIWPYYRWADFCMVTSLHDGMNLVAKEFVSVREDGDGVLILSRFTGASRELRDALLVNPYDVDATADAIRQAVEMPRRERRARMGRMRQVVGEHNIYRWAGLLLSELARLPGAAPPPPPPPRGPARAGR